jgi:hypothetical protein
MQNQNQSPPPGFLRAAEEGHANAKRIGLIAQLIRAAFKLAAFFLQMALASVSFWIIPLVRQGIGSGSLLLFGTIGWFALLMTSLTVARGTTLVAAALWTLALLIAVVAQLVGGVRRLFRRNAPIVHTWTFGHAAQWMLPLWARVLGFEGAHRPVRTALIAEPLFCFALAIPFAGLALIDRFVYGHEDAWLAVLLPIGAGVAIFLDTADFALRRRAEVRRHQEQERIHHDLADRLSERPGPDDRRGPDGVASPAEPARRK